MATKIPVGFKAPVSVGGFTDAQGNPTTIDAVLSVSVSDPSKAAIVDAGDGSGPFVVPSVVGDGQQVIFNCDVRFGPDVREVAFIGTFDVPAGEAATAEVTIGGVIPV